MGPTMPKVNIAVVVGSNRRDSINRRLAQALTHLAADKLASTFVQIDDLPMYNQDLESPLPQSVVRFKRELEAADALLIFTPEHNRSIPAVLKNAIDWGARPYGQNSWADKPAAIIGASPGAIGTAVAQQHLRQVLGDLGALVLGGEAYVSCRPDLLHDGNAVSDAGTHAFLQSFADRFADFAHRMHANKRAIAA
jgi:chromate reductase, NAD(P)H dehydrogenase (quinone)